MKINIEKEEDGRWIAEVSDLPGVLAYGTTRDDAIAKVEALALRVIADRIDHGETIPELDELFAVPAWVNGLPQVSVHPEAAKVRQMNQMIEESTAIDIRGLCWAPPILAVVGKLKTMKENDIALVVSDKESMLNDIPAICNLVECELLKTVRMKDLMLFIIKNKKWT